MWWPTLKIEAAPATEDAMSIQTLAITLGLAVLAAAPAPVHSQPKGVTLPQAYPARPIRLIIPYSPGGASDNIARIVMPRLGEALGQTMHGTGSDQRNALIRECKIALNGAGFTFHKR